MNNLGKGCTVAPPGGCNHATDGGVHATKHVTDLQPQGIKALARKVLARNQGCNQDATEPEKACNLPGEKRQQKLHRLQGIPLADLRQAAGPDWPEVERDPALLETLALAVSARRMREQGRVPPSYTCTTICAGCGPVPIFEGCPAQVLACPWCLNRHTKRPAPKVTANSAAVREDR